MRIEIDHATGPAAFPSSPQLRMNTPFAVTLDEQKYRAWLDRAW